MFRSTRRTASLALAAVGTLGACRGADLPSGHVWESQHFRYHARADDPAPCSAAIDQLDHHFEVLRARLAFPWEPAAKVDYYKFRDDVDRDDHSNCPNRFNCAWSRHVESVSVFDEHELVHAYLNGPQAPPLLLTEGLAQALSCWSPRYDFPRVTLDQILVWRPDRSDPLARGDFYDTAAWFVGHLWRKHGGARFMALYRSLPRQASRDQISRAFVERFGETIEEAWAAAFVSVDPQIGCIPLWPCEQPALPVDGSTVEWPALCAEKDARTFDLPAAASLKVVYQGTSAFPGACETGRAPLVFDGIDSPSLTLTQLPAGRYYLSKEGSFSDRIALSTLAAPLSGPACAGQSPIDLDEIHSRLSVALPEGALPVAVRLHSTSRRDGRLSIDFRDNRSLTMKVDAALCPGCGEDATACQPLSSVRDPATFEGDQVLLVRSAEPSADGFVTISLDLR